MPREIDVKKKRKALRKLRKAAELAEQGLGPALSDWEREFLEEVERRIETYGSAFADPEKGQLDEPMSALQQIKLKEIDKKARGQAKPRKYGSSFGRKKLSEPPRYGRDINEDVDEAPPPPERPVKSRPELVRRPPPAPVTPKPITSPPRKTGFQPRVIEGDKKN